MSHRAYSACCCPSPGSPRRAGCAGRAFGPYPGAGQHAAIHAPSPRSKNDRFRNTSHDRHKSGPGGFFFVPKLVTFSMSRIPVTIPHESD
ncbi:hypothetical protein BLAT2472_170046 [Burkholderia latens]